MKKVLVVLLIGLMCCMGLCACKKKEETPQQPQEEQPKKSTQADSALVGTWEEYGIPEDQQLGDYWEFKSDKKGTNGLMDMTFTYSTEDGNLYISYDEGWGDYVYTYSINGDILTLQEQGNSANQYQKR